MSYSGTGTQQDPYLVNNFTDFLTCAFEDGAFVKITEDIYASADENYTGSLGDDYIKIGAQEIYADEPKKIHGITCEGNYFIQFLQSNNDHTVKNIQFVDCSFKPLANYASSASILYADTSVGYFMESALSIEYVYQSSASTFAGSITNASRGKAIRATLSSFDIAYHITDNKNTISDFRVCSLDRCNVILRNYFLNTASATDEHKFAGMHSSYPINDTSFILINLADTYHVSHPDDSSFRQIGIGNASNSYIVIADSDLQHLKLNTLSGSSNVLACYSNCTNVEEGGIGYIKVTPEQLKNEDYLRQIGFLP